MNKLMTFCLIALLLSPIAGLHAAEVSNLRCEYLSAPLGIDVVKPRLSWVMESPLRGEKQTAYRVLVASSAELLKKDRGDLWDSGKVVSDQSIQVEYAGKTLESRMRCYWKVRIWDKDGKASDWSRPTSWTMGLLQPADWKGKWITQGEDTQSIGGRMPIFRKSFTVTRKLKRAELFVCALGCGDVHINGAPVDDSVFEPGWTLYSKTCLYRTYDISSRIGKGENVLGVMLGNGMYNVKGGHYTKFTGSFGPPKLIAQIHLEYTDGSSEVLASDASWLTAPGPITFSCVYGGEDYDARLECNGWDKPGFVPDVAWKKSGVTEGPGGKLAGSSRSAPPVKVIQTLPVAMKTKLKPGVWLYDMGQNCSMLPKITVQGPAGSKITILTGERFEGGKFVGACDKLMSFNYTLKGGTAKETWSPRFCYAGARYLQIEGAEAVGVAASNSMPVVLSVERLFVSGSETLVGDFSCSNDLFNRTLNIIRWAIRCNMMSILTDCPHREKLGWLEQVHLVGPSIKYGYDIATLLTKMEGDMADSQRENGLIPDIAPEYVVFTGGFVDTPAWGSACILVPWNLYRWYGDVDVLRRSYPVMQRYLAYLDSKSKDHTLSYGLADWYALDRTSREATATAFYYLDSIVMEKTARLLGKTEDAELYGKKASEVRTAYNVKLFKGSSYGSQTANALPLSMGIVEPTNVPAVLDAIVSDIRKRDNSLTSGDVGYRYLLRALADNGRSDVIYDMNSRSDKPGYGMILAKGNTSLTEPWNGSPSASSNHFMLGHIMEWFYADLAGIQGDPDLPAFRRIVIKPQIVGDLTWVKAHYDSPYGRIISNWRLVGNKLTMEVTIPPNTTAAVYVPANDAAGMTESGKPVAKAEGVKFLRFESGVAIYSVGSGSYRFQSTLAVVMK